MDHRSITGGEFFAILAWISTGLGLVLLVKDFAAASALRRKANSSLWMGDIPRKRNILQEMRRIKSRLDTSLHQLCIKGPGAGLVCVWEDSGLPGGLTGFLVVILVLFSGGCLVINAAVHRVLLGVFSGAALSGGFISVVIFQAALRRRRFEEQFPELVDRIADSLQAGHTLRQAVHFVGPNLLEPSSKEMVLVDKKVNLGVPLLDAFNELYQRHGFEDLHLFIEMLTLHQTVGGDVVSMVRDLSRVVRERIELEKDIRTLTAQGRLSALVITLLVPVSLGVLAFFPGYLDVLFRTTPGNLILITAVVLDILGGLIVRRLIKVEV